MGTLAVVGAGFVADFYMRSATVFPEHRFVGVWDRDPERLATFAAHWNVPAAASLEQLLHGPRRPQLLLNLTNPRSHVEINRAALEAGVPVYCEKPLATTLLDACALVALAARRGVPIASAPSSVLSPTAQTLWWAVRNRVVGKPQLVLAELDDGYVAQAPWRTWRSESGAPWPGRDEFEVGCTLEHAGYYLTWLMAMFGPVRAVTAASACLVPGKLRDGAPTAPDFSTATLFFDDGVVARLTCSILARHDHRIRVIGERGTLRVDAAWNNRAPVRVERRTAVRRKLVEGLVPERVALLRPPGQRSFRRPPLAMNFMLGPDEMLRAMDAGAPPRLAGDFALHLTEVTLAIQNSGRSGAQDIASTFAPMLPLPWARPARRRRTMNRIKAGIVGTGRMAAAMVEAMAADPRFVPVAVTSRDEGRAREFATDHRLDRAYGSLAAMLASDIDVVYVANDSARHAETAIACLAAKKPVLCEKPFAISVEEGARVVAAAKDAGVLFMEAYFTPFLPAHRRAVALATGGELGRPVQLAADFGYPASRESMPRLFAGPGAGVVLDAMIYPLGLALLVLGDVTQVRAAVTFEDGVDVHAALQLSHADGGVSQVSASCVTLMGNAASIALTGGSIRIAEPLAGAEQITVRRMVPPSGTEAGTSPTAPRPGEGTRANLAARVKRSGIARRVGRVVAAPRTEQHPYGASRYAPMLAHFAALLDGGRTESEVVGHGFSMAVQRVFAAALSQAPTPAPRALPAPSQDAPREPSSAAAQSAADMIAAAD